MAEEELTKEYLYTALCEMVRETGQGIPYQLLVDAAKVHADELIKEGKCKKIIISNAYMPDDIFLCLTKGYCVEESLKEGKFVHLLFIRYYLGEKELAADSGPLRMTKEDFEKDKKTFADYIVWKEENKEALEELKNAN